MLSDEQILIESDTPAQEETQDRRNLIDPQTMEQFYPVTVPEAVLDLEEFVSNVVFDSITLKSPIGDLYSVSVSDEGTLVVTKQTA